MATKKTTKKKIDTAPVEENKEFRADLTIELDNNDPEFVTKVETGGLSKLKLIQAGREIQRMMFFAFDENKEVPFILKHMIGYGTKEVHIESECSVETVSLQYIILRFIFNDGYTVQCTIYTNGELHLSTEGCSLLSRILTPFDFGDEFYNYIVKKYKGLDCLSRLRVKEADVKLF